MRGLEEARLDEAAILLELLPGDEDAAEPPELGGEAPDGMRRPAAATDSSRCFFLACNKEEEEENTKVTLADSKHIFQIVKAR